MNGIDSTLQNLVSALGGRDPAEPGNPYVLGDDGLGCLRDIKRWLQHYDEKKDVWEVKAALASMNFVATDLCPILASWTISDMDDEHKRRICLACVEILVPVTWPMELGPEADEYKYRQYPNLRLAQSNYKRAMLFDPENDILGSVLRVAYPSLAIPRRQRTEKDTGIIRLVIYLLRNLAAIDEGHSRSDTILAFAKANALDLLCVLASSMGDEFTSEDVIVLDTIYCLVRGVPIRFLFDLVNTESDTIKNELTDLLAREKDMKTNNKKQAHTRHNRFGTMVSVVQESRRFTVASQTAILRKLPGSNFADIEASKKWNRPQKQLKTQDDLEQKITLNTEARLALANFVTTFLDAGFNPLFLSLLKALENDDARISQSNRVQFLYLQGWSFHALREKGQAINKKEKRGSDFADDADYQLIASMMESRATIMLRKMLRESIEMKLWKDTQAAMNCLKELLLTINAMSMSSDPEYQDIAENLQSNLYYEESNLDLVATCVRTYTNQSIGYLDACTDLAAVLLKMLEKYASSRTHMFVRARRQRQRKVGSKPQNQDAQVDSDDEEAEANARETVKERAFNFAKFEAKFINEHSVDTFVSFLEFYADLSSEQIKRIITFFHRIFVKQKIEILLYRLELFELLHRMLSDTVNLSAKNPARAEVENFTIYMIKRFSRTIEDCPALAWEILFEKLSQDPYYLTHDVNKAPIERKAPRPPAEFEVRPSLSHEDQIRVAVGVLLDDNRHEVLEWLKDHLAQVVTKRIAWDASMKSREDADQNGSTLSVQPSQSAEPVVPSSEEMKLLFFKDGKIRLLLKVLALERIGDRFDESAIWIVPTTLETDALDTDVQTIKDLLKDPPMFDDDKKASDYIRRQVIKHDSYDTDDELLASSEDEDFSVAQAKKKKKTLTRRPRGNLDLEIDEEELEARRLKREQLEEQRRGQIKSSKYVHDSDDEDDEASNAIFFAAEAALRERQASKAKQAPHVTTAKVKKIDKRGKKQMKSKKMDNLESASSSDKENRDLDIGVDDVSEIGSEESDTNHLADRKTRKRVSGSVLSHGNALFVEDESDQEVNRRTKKSKLMERKSVGRHIVDSDDE